MNDEEVPDSAGFNANYRLLKETADWLAHQEEPDIDQLVPRVERAMRAYQLCKDRLDQVQTTLGQYLQGGDGGANGVAEASADGDGRLRGSGRRWSGADGDGDLRP
jgi:exodeoxyribonuclease VII small subunit